MKIRITLHRREIRWERHTAPADTIVRVFTDVDEALNWFLHDSYFEEPYTVKAVWERIEEHDDHESM